MKFTVRKFTRKNIAQIAPVISAALEKDMPYKRNTVKAYQKLYNTLYFTKKLKNKKNLLLGAYLKKELAGVISVDDWDGGVAFINWLVVKPSYRGQGVGTLLLNETKKWALKTKNHYAMLNTETEKNIAFYKKRGFTYVGCQKNSWFGENEYLMEQSYRATPFPEIF